MKLISVTKRYFFNFKYSLEGEPSYFEGLLTLKTKLLKGMIKGNIEGLEGIEGILRGLV